MFSHERLHDEFGPSRSNTYNTLSYLAKISQEKLLHQTHGGEYWGDTDEVEVKIPLTKFNMDYTTRAAYEFIDQDYWHDLEIQKMSVRFLIDDQFFAVKDLNGEEFFDLIYDLEKALIRDDPRARTDFMNKLDKHEWYSEGFTKESLNTTKLAQMWVKFTFDNPNHRKNIEARIQDDYDEVAKDFVSQNKLLSMKDIDEIESSGEPFESKSFERKVRARMRQEKEIEDEIEPDVNDDEIAAEEYAREMEALTRLDAHRSPYNLRPRKPINYYKTGRGLLDHHKELTRKLSSFFSFRN